MDPLPQLADFLVVPLKRAGGTLTLPEAFCLFNRARGAELVSPDDLLRVCQMWSSLGVPLRLRKFESGLIVVQSGSLDDNDVRCNDYRSIPLSFVPLM